MAPVCTYGQQAAANPRCGVWLSAVLSGRGVTSALAGSWAPAVSVPARHPGQRWVGAEGGSAVEAGGRVRGTAGSVSQSAESLGGPGWGGGVGGGVPRPFPENGGTP